MPNLSTNKRIAIIGAGQLGSRHLQGLKKVSFPLSIDVLDNSDDSLAIAKNRYNETPNNTCNHSIRFINTIADLNDDLDLVIIATSSGPRYSVTLELVKTKKIKYILFEKIVFQKIDQYEIIEKLLIHNNIRAWVNCPLRTYTIFQKIKSTFTGQGPISFCVEGGNWGLGCNAIHYIDCLSFLSESQLFCFSTESLDKEFYKSKRIGYLEIAGILSGRTEQNDILSLISNKDIDQPTIISIQNKQNTIIIDLTHNILSQRINGEWTQLSIEIPYQSQQTNHIVEQILVFGTSELTEYTTSMKLHLPYIQSILNFYNKIYNTNISICPLT